MLKVHISTLADKTTSLYKAHEHLCHHNIHALFAVNGATELNVTEGMAIFRILDDDGNGILTIKDVINGLANHKEVLTRLLVYSRVLTKLNVFLMKLIRTETKWYPKRNGKTFWH